MTDSLLVITWDLMGCFWHKVQFHSLPVDYGVRYNVINKQLCHTLAVGHHGGNINVTKQKCRVTHNLFAILREVTDKDGISLTDYLLQDKRQWVVENFIRLTICWSSVEQGNRDMIDKSAWQRSKALPLTPCWSWQMRYDWSECLAKKWTSVTHSLLPVVMGWEMIDESAWQGNKPVSLTPCWSWDETWLIRLTGKEIKQCHSLLVGHDWWECLAKK